VHADRAAIGSAVFAGRAHVYFTSPPPRTLRGFTSSKRAKISAGERPRCWSSRSGGRDGSSRARRYSLQPELEPSTALRNGISTVSLPARSAWCPGSAIGSPARTGPRGSTRSGCVPDPAAAAALHLLLQPLPPRAVLNVHELDADAAAIYGARAAAAGPSGAGVGNGSGVRYWPADRARPVGIPSGGRCRRLARARPRTGT